MNTELDLLPVVIDREDLSDPLVHDVRYVLPEELREEFLNRRTTSADLEACSCQESDGRRWEPLRPVIIGEGHTEALSLSQPGCCDWPWPRTVAVPRRWAKLSRVLGLRLDRPPMDLDRPLVAAELCRYARPDILIEQGRPRFLGFNNSTRLGGVTVTPQLAEA